MGSDSFYMLGLRRCTLKSAERYKYYTLNSVKTKALPVHQKVEFF